MQESGNGRRPVRQLGVPLHGVAVAHLRRYGAWSRLGRVMSFPATLRMLHGVDLGAAVVIGMRWRTRPTY